MDQRNERLQQLHLKLLQVIDDLRDIQFPDVEELTKWEEWWKVDTKDSENRKRPQFELIKNPNWPS